MKMTSYTSALILSAALPLFATHAQAGLLDSAKNALNATSTSSSTPSTTTPVSGDLVAMVTSGLGISSQQASGGLGALFKTAKGELSDNDFGQLASAVPNMEQLLGAAPEVELITGGGGPLPQAGPLSKSLGGASYLNSAFKKLGLSPDQIAPLTNIAVQYLESSSPEAAALLKQVTGGLM